MALPSYQDFISDPDFKNADADTKQQYNDKYWSLYHQENPNDEWGKQMQESSNSAIAAKREMADAPPVLQRVLKNNQDVANLNIQLGLADKAGAWQSPEERQAFVADKQSSIKSNIDTTNKTLSLFSDPKVDEAMQPAWQALTSSAAMGEVFAKPDTWGDTALKAATYAVTAGGSSANRDKAKSDYEKYRRTMAQDFGLTTDEVDDLVKHRMDLQSDPVSRDVAGQIHFRTDLLSKPTSAIEKAINDSKLPESVKSKAREQAPEKIALFKQGVLDRVKKDYPDLAADMTWSGKVDEDYATLTKQLNVSSTEQLGGGVAGAALSGLFAQVPSYAIAPQPGMREVSREQIQNEAERRKAADTAARKQQAINELSSFINSDKTKILGVDAATVGQGAYSVAESVAIAAATGGLGDIVVPASKLEKAGKVGKALLGFSKGTLNTAPVAGIYGTQQGFQTYEQALASNDPKVRENAANLAVGSAAIEFGVTTVFGGIGLGGTEDFAGKFASPALRKEAATSISKAWKNLAKNAGEIVVGEAPEEAIITALNSVHIQQKLNPQMTDADVRKALYDTIVSTILTTAPLGGVKAGKEALKDFSNITTHDRSTDELKREADDIYQAAAQEGLAEDQTARGNEPPPSPERVAELGAERTQLSEQLKRTPVGGERWLGLKERILEINNILGNEQDTTATGGEQNAPQALQLPKVPTEPTAPTNGGATGGAPQGAGVAQAQAETAIAPGTPVLAVHYSRTPLSLQKGADLTKIPGKYEEKSILGDGFYAMEPSDEKLWTEEVQRFEVGSNRNEVTVTPQKPLVITPQSLGTVDVEALKADLESGKYDAVIIRGFDPENDASEAIRKRVEELWSPKFPAGKTEGRFVNGDEYDAALEQATQEVLGISATKFEEIHSAGLDMNQIFVPKDSAPDIVKIKSSVPTETPTATLPAGQAAPSQEGAAQAPVAPTTQNDGQKEAQGQGQVLSPAPSGEQSPAAVSSGQQQQTTQTNATQKGEIQQGNLGEYPQGNEARKITETGSGDSPVSSGQEQAQAPFQTLTAEDIKKEAPHLPDEVAEMSALLFNTVAPDIQKPLKVVGQPQQKMTQGELFQQDTPQPLPEAEIPSRQATKTEAAGGLSYAELEAHPTALKKIVNKLRMHKVFRVGPGNTVQAAKRIMDQMVANILKVHDMVPKDIREQSKLWYSGANKISHRWSQQFGVSTQAVAGAIAAMSPQKDWFQNVSLAERLLSIWTGQNRETDTFNEGMRDAAKKMDAAQAKAAKGKGYLLVEGEEVPLMAHEARLNQLIGKRFDDLEAEDKAFFVRLYDSTYNDPSYALVSPDGRFGKFHNNKDGKPTRIAWGSNTEVSKAIRILENPSVANISEQLGKAHKIRSFYNNIINPDSDETVTSDTHAVAVAYLLPLSGSSMEVSHNFGGTGSGSFKGTYAFIAEAYRRAAAARGIKPSQMQSITWEAVREIYTAATKRNESTVAKIRKLWEDYSRGKTDKSYEQTADEAIAAGGGYSFPAWYKQSELGFGDSGTAFDRDTTFTSKRGGTGTDGLRAGAGRGDGRGSQPARPRPQGGAEQGTLFQAERPEQSGVTRGAITFAADMGQAWITLMQHANASTFPHELAHFLRRFVLADNAEARAAAERRDISVEEIQNLAKWAGVGADGVWTTKAEEKFARGFERYLAEGKAPTPALQALFDKFSAWLKEIYGAVTNSNINVAISPEVRAVFDKLMMGPTKTGAKPAAKPAPAPAEDITGIRREITDADRRTYGLPKYDPAAPVTDQQVMDEAVKRLKATDGKHKVGEELVAEIEGRAAPADMVERVLLGIEGKRLQGVIDQLHSQIAKATNLSYAQSKEAELIKALTNLNVIVDQLATSGHLAGLNLQKMKMQWNKQFELVPMLTRFTQAKRNSLGDQKATLTKEEIAEVKKNSEAILKAKKNEAAALEAQAKELRAKEAEGVVKALARDVKGKTAPAKESVRKQLRASFDVRGAAERLRAMGFGVRLEQRDQPAPRARFYSKIRPEETIYNEGPGFNPEAKGFRFFSEKSKDISHSTGEYTVLPPSHDFVFNGSAPRQYALVKLEDGSDYKVALSEVKGSRRIEDGEYTHSTGELFSHGSVTGKEYNQKLEKSFREDQYRSRGRGQTVRKALSLVPSTHSLKPLAKQLERFSSKKLDSDTLRPEGLTGPQDLRAFRSYSGYIGAGSGGMSVQALIHETLHTLTADAISKYVPQFDGRYAKKLILETVKDNVHTPQAISDLIEAYESTLTQLGLTDKYLGSSPDTGIASDNPDITTSSGGDYSLSNLHEFVAQAFSSKEFQDTLRGLKGTGNKTIWQNFIDAIRALLKISSDTSTTMLESVISAALDVASLRVDAPLDSTGSISNASPLLQQDLDPAVLDDLATIGAGLILDEKIKNINEFTASIVNAMGPQAMDYASEIYQRAQDKIEAARKSRKIPKSPEQLLKEVDPEKELSNRMVFNMVRGYLLQGMEPDKVLHQVHQDLTEIWEDISFEEVSDAFTGYGKIKYPSTEEINVQLRHLRNVERIKRQLDVVRSGQAPKKTGFQRDKADAEIRTLQKELKTAMKDAGIKVTRSNQLKSSLDAIKTRFQNELEDLQRAINKREALPPKKAPEEYDQETKDLKARVDQKRAEYAAIFEDKSLTEKQQLKQALASINRSIAEEEDMLAKGILSKPKASKRVFDDPEFKAAEARLEALRSARHAAQRALRPRKSQEQIALDAAIRENKKGLARDEERVRTGDTAARTTTPRFTPNEELKAILAERASLKQILKLQRQQKARLGKPERDAARQEQRAAEAIERSLKKIEERIQELASGKVTPVRRILPFTTPGLSVARSLRDSRRRVLAEMEKSLKQTKSAEDIRNDRMFKAAVAKKARFQEMLDKGIHTKEPKVSKAVAEWVAQAQFEAAAVEAEWNKLRAKMLWENKTLPAKVWSRLHTALRGTVLTRLGGDINLLRHAGVWSLSNFWLHPVKTASVLKRAATSGLTERGAYAIYQANREALDRAGFSEKEIRLLNPIQPSGTGGTSRVSEEITGADLLDMAARLPKKTVIGLGARLLRSIEFVNMSILNTARAETALALRGSLELPVDDATRRAIAIAAEVSSGRGFIKNENIERAVPFLNDWVFISARWTLSRIQMAYGKPLWSSGISMGTRAKIFHHVYGKTLIGRAILSTVIAAMFKPKDDESEEEFFKRVLRSMGYGDPRDPSYGKLKLSNGFTIDLGQGVSPFMGVMARIITGKTVRDGELVKLRDPEKGRALSSYLQNRANMVTSSLIRTFVTGEAYGGQKLPSISRIYGTLEGTEEYPVNQTMIAQTAKEWFAPIIYQDTINIYKQFGVKGVALWSTMMTGAGVQSYQPKPKKEKFY